MTHPESRIQPPETPSREEDERLVRAAQAGDQDAFGQLVGRHQARAWRVARGLVGSDEDAQDLVQEAFLRVFRGLDRFDFQYAFSTWLYRIVTNLCIDHLRKRRRLHSLSGALEDDGQDLLEIDLPDPRDEQPSDALVSEETADQVRQILDGLAPHFRTALVLRELEGLSCKEIAEVVGATHVTVRWRLHRGRKLFLDAWTRLHGEDGVTSPWDLDNESEA
ncbi:MAG: sigma-70 family RNA polymerase sigma factor [Planctomycetes bacterium]|nr:sigma-70 family RNA polymerase sigma factor [Planctomycetota bacterium]HRV80946.1 sigma-70 family RNA polymerase sigma factor [Planctomycetota bacterium]